MQRQLADLRNGSEPSTADYVPTREELLQRFNVSDESITEMNLNRAAGTEELSSFEPCCFDRGYGQDPIEYLEGEIARVERELAGREDEDREFSTDVQGYLPRDGRELVLKIS